MQYVIIIHWFGMVKSVYVVLNMQINEKVMLHVERQVGSGTRAGPC